MNTTAIEKKAGYSVESPNGVTVFVEKWDEDTWLVTVGATEFRVYIETYGWFTAYSSKVNFRVTYKTFDECKNDMYAVCGA